MSVELIKVYAHLVAVRGEDADGEQFEELAFVASIHRDAPSMREVAGQVPFFLLDAYLLDGLQVRTGVSLAEAQR
jgi:hypothetical protein